METIAINNLEYFNADDVFINAPIYCKKARTSRDLIRKKNIDENTFIYGRKTENGWSQTTGKSIKFDKILILKSFCETIPELKTENDEIIKDDNGIEKAPEIVILDDSEKFKDENGNVLEIETRGERTVSGLFFKVKDVEKLFCLMQLSKTIIDTQNNYVHLLHYKYFMCEKNISDEKNRRKETIKKTLYLTYEGILRVLFTTKNNKTTPFIKWAVETLFTVQLGNEKNKNTLISKMKGVSYSAIQELFNINAKSIPCVYLTVLNTVGTLREKMNISKDFNDDDCVYKFGLTSSFEQRKNGHKSEYKELEPLLEFKLIQFAYIDPLFLTEAENYIKTLFAENFLEYKKHTELIILSKKELIHIKSSYELIARKYSGHNEELLKEIENLKSEIINTRLKCDHQIELLKQQTASETEMKLLKQQTASEIAMSKKQTDMEMDFLKKQSQSELANALLQKELEIYKQLHKFQ